jgi:undecaprenyl phosphate-alpha-L-ara4N flippase subunit ArnF
MQATTVVLILGAVAFSALGQLLLKSGAQHLAGLGRLEFLLAAARDIHVLAGLVAWVASTLCWLYVLRVAPLSRAYGLTSLTYVLIFLASVSVFGEQVRRLHAVGTLLIIIGVACLLAFWGLRVVQEVMGRAYFRLCLALGWLLRAGRYSKAQIVCEDGERQVRKYRLCYAPLLVWMGGPLVRLLDTGVRVLPQRAWEARERQVYRRLYGTSIRIEADGTLVLPYLAGETLATLLEDRKLEDPVRKRAIERAVVALAEFHHLGLTHGDAMAENVLVDLEAGVAHWFDFETIHETRRPLAWQRADDVRALLVTCLVRTAPEKRAETLQLILDLYPDEEVPRVLIASFTSVWRRPLPFYLAQAALSFQSFQEIARLLSERLRQ